MPATTIGLGTLIFGTTEDSGTVVRSYEESIKCDPVELLSGDGTFKAVAFSNPNSSINVTLVSGSASDSIGTTLTNTGSNTFLTGIDTIYVDSLTRTLTNDGFSETQISGSGWSNLGSST